MCRCRNTSLRHHRVSQLIIDTTNPGAFGADGFRLVTAANGGSFSSSGESFAKFLPGADVVKAFNSIGAGLMANPIAHGKPLQMMWAGVQSPIAEGIIRDVGFEPHYVGGIIVSRNLESICELWVNLAYAYKVRCHRCGVSCTLHRGLALFAAPNAVCC